MANQFEEILATIEVLKTIVETIEAIPKAEMTLTQRVLAKDIEGRIDLCIAMVDKSKSKTDRRQIVDHLESLVTDMKTLKNGFCHG